MKATGGVLFFIYTTSFAANLASITNSPELRVIPLLSSAFTLFSYRVSCYFNYYLLDYFEIKNVTFRHLAPELPLHTPPETYHKTGNNNWTQG